MCSVLVCSVLFTPLLPFCFSSGFSGNSGYDQAAAEAFIDARSSDQQWTARQKELLSKCSALSQQAPAEKQGVFVLVCWTQLTIAECNRKRLADAAVDANPESGEEVAEQVALMAEGHCLKAELEYSQEVNQAWKTCAAAGELDGSVLMAAGAYYKMLAKDSDSLPELTAENVTNVDAELKKINGVIDCYAQASGEVSSDGAINYDTMLSIIDAAKGKQHVKDAAKKVVEHCQEQAPENISEFYECFAEAQPYACVALRSYAIISGRAGRRSCNRNGRSIAAP